MQQLALFDEPRKLAIPIDKPAAPFAPGSATSQAAARAIAGEVRYIRQRVMALIRARREYGATDEEICTALDLASDTGRPRRVELRDASLIIDSGQTRPTRSGRAATVWVISPRIGFNHE